jgi:hypothetical protein
MEDDLKKQTKKEDDLNLFSIPLKSRGKPFLGLAQLSKIYRFISASTAANLYKGNI